MKTTICSHYGCESAKLENFKYVFTHNYILDANIHTGFLPCCWMKLFTNKFTGANKSKGV